MDSVQVGIGIELMPMAWAVLPKFFKQQVQDNELAATSYTFCWLMFIIDVIAYRKPQGGNDGGARG